MTAASTHPHPEESLPAQAAELPLWVATTLTLAETMMRESWATGADSAWTPRYSELRAHLEKVDAALRTQAAEAEALRADALRYRWLREAMNDDGAMQAAALSCVIEETAEKMDAAIDAARQQQESAG